MVDEGRKRGEEEEERSSSNIYMSIHIR